MRRGIVIAGAGLAGQRCAERLRAAGHDGPITIVGSEPHRPYDRPPLSKPSDPGDSGPRHLRPSAWYADHAVGLRTGTAATGVDVRGRTVLLADGSHLPFDRLLVATGAAPVVPRLFAGCTANVQSLRSHDDAVRLRAALRPGGRLVIVGAGLIGQEVASTAAALGAEVTLVDAAPDPFSGVVGPALGRWLEGLHREAGVDVRTGVGVEGLEGDGRAEAVVLADGRRVACDHVVVGVGVRPDTAWVTPAHPHGLPVDAAGRTALPSVLAAGDAALPLDPLTGRHRSAGHWEAAARQGATAAATMLGLAPPPPAVPLVWTDQHGIRIQCLGDLRGTDAVELDGDPRERRFVLVHHRAGRPVGAVLTGRADALGALRRRLQDHLAHPETGVAA